MVCMDARQAHAALSISINKTDANDAQGLAHLLRTGLFREVRVKGWEDMRKRALLRARATMLRCVLDLANAIRGALRTFGISLAAGTRNGGARTFERRVLVHLSARADLDVIIGPLLEAWRAGRAQVARHERAIRAVVRADPSCQLMMTAPGVGYLTAVGFVGAIGDPATFRSGRTAAAWIGLTPRRYQSGTINLQGRISRHLLAVLDALHQVDKGFLLLRRQGGSDPSIRLHRSPDAFRECITAKVGETDFVLAPEAAPGEPAGDQFLHGRIHGEIVRVEEPDDIRRCISTPADRVENGELRTGNPQALRRLLESCFVHSAGQHQLITGSGFHPIGFGP